VTGPEATSEQPKPRWRGRLHQIAFFCSLPMAAALVAAARGVTARAATVVYAATLVGMFGVSAAYHRLKWSARALVRIRKLDHSMIYLLIAGTYTPFALLVLHGTWRLWLLAAVWGGATAGVALKLLRFNRSHVASGVLYIALGWGAVFAAPLFVHHLSAPVLALVVTGGVLYTSGGLDPQAAPPRSQAPRIRVSRGVALLHGERQHVPLLRGAHAGGRGEIEGVRIRARRRVRGFRRASLRRASFGTGA